MARFAIEGRIDRAESLQDFGVEGYRFDPTASKANDWVFTRDHPSLKST
jgi:uncharacterized protein